MKICCVQFAPVWGEIGVNLRKAERLIREASETGADLVCFPEQFLTGWSPAPPFEPEDEHGRCVTALRTFARDHRIAILGSFLERHSPRPRNTALLLDGRGEIRGKYAKMHPFAPGGEDRFIQAGEEMPILECCALRLGIAICYDLRFPLLFRSYAEAGAVLVLVPAAWPCRRMEHWELLLRARALENQMYVAGINCTGKTPIDEYCGGTMIAGPEGEAIARAGSEETLLYATIDPDAVRRAREAFPVFGRG